MLHRAIMNCTHRAIRRILQYIHNPYWLLLVNYRARKIGAVPVKMPGPGLVRDAFRQDSLQPASTPTKRQDSGKIISCQLASLLYLHISFQHHPLNLPLVSLNFSLLIQLFTLLGHLFLHLLVRHRLTSTILQQHSHQPKAMTPIRNLFLSLSLM